MLRHRSPFVACVGWNRTSWVPGRGGQMGAAPLERRSNEQVGYVCFIHRFLSSVLFVISISLRTAKPFRVSSRRPRCFLMRAAYAGEHACGHFLGRSFAVPFCGMHFVTSPFYITVIACA